MNSNFPRVPNHVFADPPDVSAPDWRHIGKVWRHTPSQGLQPYLARGIPMPLSPHTSHLPCNHPGGRGEPTSKNIVQRTIDLNLCFVYLAPLTEGKPDSRSQVDRAVGLGPRRISASPGATLRDDAKATRNPGI